ncbi:MAG: hypothetical protein ABIE14_04025 [Patescibacteria group bacterium]
MTISTENSFLASLCASCEDLQREFQENPEIINEQTARLKIANLLGGLKVAEEAGMDLFKIKLSQTNVKKVFEKLPENIRAEIDQFLEDPISKPQANHFHHKNKNVPSWLKPFTERERS